MDPTQTRGFQNHNPGNIERTKEMWRGMAKDQSTDKRFVVFDAPEWGIRAIVKVLISYQKIGVDTIRAMIEKWAPPVENNTAGYIARVCKSTGLDEDDVPDMFDYKHAKAMVEAIIGVELGGQPYSMRIIDEGLKLAGVAKSAGLTTSNTIRGGAVSVSGTSMSLLADQVQSAADTIQPIAANGWASKAFLALKVAGVVLAIAGVMWVVYERYLRAKRDKEIYR